MDHASDPINSANPHLTRARLRPPNQNGPSPITINGDSEEEAEADKRPSKLPKASQDADEDAEYKPKSHESTRSAQEAYFIEILNTVKENAKDDPDFDYAGDIPVQLKPPQLPKDLTTSHQRILRLSLERHTTKVQNPLLRKRITELKEEAEKRKFKFQELSAQLRAAEEKNQELEKNFKEIQDEQLQLIGKDKIPCEPDSEVSAELAKIFRSSKSWASRWAIAEWTGLCDSEIDRITSFLRDGVVGRLATERFMTLVERKQVSSRMVTSAVVNRMICYATLQNPFKHLLLDETDSRDETVEDALNWTVVMAKMSKYFHPDPRI